MQKISKNKTGINYIKNTLTKQFNIINKVKYKIINKIK